jgi:hypothetical protein
MHFRRFATFLLGAWLAGTVLLYVFAVQNASLAGQTFQSLSPVAAAQFRGVPAEQAQTLLRYAAAQQTRWFTEVWGNTQILLGTVLFLYMLFGTREGKLALALATFMLVMALGQRIVLAPEMDALGRLSDFVPPGAITGDRTKWEVMRAAYLGLDIVKWGAGLFLTAAFLFGARRGLDLSRQNLNVVDKPNHRHVNR